MVDVARKRQLEDDPALVDLLVVGLDGSAGYATSEHNGMWSDLESLVSQGEGGLTKPQLIGEPAPTIFNEAEAGPGTSRSRMWRSRKIQHKRGEDLQRLFLRLITRSPADQQLLYHGEESGWYSRQYDSVLVYGQENVLGDTTVLYGYYDVVM